MIKFVIEVDLPNASNYSLDMFARFIREDVQLLMEEAGGELLDSYVIRVDEDGVEIGEED